MYPTNHLLAVVTLLNELTTAEAALKIATIASIALTPSRGTKSRYGHLWSREAKINVVGLAGGNAMIALVDMLQAAKVKSSPPDTKVHLACWNGREHPIEVYYAGQFSNWQAHQTRRNFECKHVLS